MSRGASLRAALLAVALAVPLLPAKAQEPAAEGWRPFRATWTFSGERQLLPTEGDRPASIVHVEGTLTLTSGEGLGRGFLVEMIAFDDGRSLLVGRSVLSDGRADRIFATIRAEPMGTGRRATGTITGGTGRFKGIEGTFTFGWQYVVDAGSGEIGGRTVDLEGRTRLATPPGSQVPR